MFCPPHFWLLVRFLCASCVRQVECIVGHSPLVLPLKSDLFFAFAVKFVRLCCSFPDRVCLCQLVVGWLVHCCFLLVAVVIAFPYPFLWLILPHRSLFGLRHVCQLPRQTVFTPSKVHRKAIISITCSRVGLGRRFRNQLFAPHVIMHMWTVCL